MKTKKNDTSSQQIKKTNSKYLTHVRPYLDKIEEWVKKGATQEEVAKNLHIAESTLALYLAKGREGKEPYSELVDLYARAQEEPDDNVEAALYKSATGYTVEVQKAFKVRVATFDPVTGKKIEEHEEIIQGPDQVHVPANVEAQKFWLINRRRDKWKLKPETEGEDASESGIVLIAPVLEKEKPPAADDEPKQPPKIE